MSMNLKQSIFSLLAATAIVVGLCVAPAFADDASVTFEDGALIAFAPGSAYTDTDLFDNFKGLMPGDTRNEDILVKNEASDFDYIKVYMKAVSHTDVQGDNPISPKVLAELTADARRGSMSELDYMQDFLSQLSLEVTQGDTTLYTGSPDELDGLAEPVYLGELAKGEAITLHATLVAPLALDNAYAHRVGEVDWVFVVEGYNNPETLPSLIQTGQLLWPVLVFGGLGAIVIACGIFLRRKNRKNEDG